MGPQRVWVEPQLAVLHQDYRPVTVTYDLAEQLCPIDLNEGHDPVS